MDAGAGIMNAALKRAAREGSDGPRRLDILDLTFPALQARFAEWGEPRFRAQQLWRWIYVHLADDFEQMTNLPRALRERLAPLYRLDPLRPVGEQVAEDGLTRKALLELPDGATIESVLMAYEPVDGVYSRHTVCVSTQVGCPIGCAFCATGQSGFVRDLSTAEIVAQPLYFARLLRASNQAVSNVVVMGMGEPLLNYDRVWQAIETWNDHQGFNLGARKITLSTAGYVPGIERLAGERLQVGLAVSLHAVDDALRDQLVPLNRRYPLAVLLAALRDYQARTGRRITVEYALIEGLNDDPLQATYLANMLRGLDSHVNLIPLNPTAGSPYRPSPQPRVDAFQQALVERGVPATVRLRRGIDIQAGCGQLRQRDQEGRAAATDPLAE
jgi:23S rRNA (adenine2503-C2)-methyltransferase